jgi:putative DNA primase/helicase
MKRDRKEALRRVAFRLLYADPDLDELAAGPDDATSDEPEQERQSTVPDTSIMNSISVDELARAITTTADFSQDAGGKLYVFENGVYKPAGEDFIKKRVKTLMKEWKLAGSWTSRKAQEVCEYIRVDAPVLWKQPPGDVVNVKNGLLNVVTRELQLHSPAFLSPIQLPVSYDPTARCEFWEQFVTDVFPLDSRETAWQVLAWLMTPDTSIQKAILLLGEGANGKSAYLEALRAFVGQSNTTAISLQKISQDKFAAARLLGKLANICPDLPTASLADTSIFKAITGGDTINAEYKYQNSFEFTPFAKLIFSANQPPRSADSSYGFFRRWFVLPFTRTFEEGDTTTMSARRAGCQTCRPR